MVSRYLSSPPTAMQGRMSCPCDHLMGRRLRRWGQSGIQVLSPVLIPGWSPQHQKPLALTSSHFCPRPAGLMLTRTGLQLGDTSEDDCSDPRGELRGGVEAAVDSGIVLSLMVYGKGTPKHRKSPPLAAASHGNTMYHIIMEPQFPVGPLSIILNKSYKGICIFKDLILEICKQ